MHHTHARTQTINAMTSHVFKSKTHESPRNWLDVGYRCVIKQTLKSSCSVPVFVPNPNKKVIIIQYNTFFVRNLGL